MSDHRRAQTLAAWGIGPRARGRPARRAARRRASPARRCRPHRHRSRERCRAPRCGLRVRSAGRRGTRPRRHRVPLGAGGGDRDGALVHAIDFDDTHGGGLVHATAVVLPQRSPSGSTPARADSTCSSPRCSATRSSAGSRWPRHGFHARGLHATQVAACSRPRPSSRRRRLRRRHHGQRARHRRQQRGRPARVPDHRRLDQAAPPGQRLDQRPARRAPRGVPARPARRRCSRDRTASTPRCRARPPTSTRITGQLGERWETTRIGIKPYPSCQLMHVSLDATRQLLDRDPVARRRRANRRARPPGQRADGVRAGRPQGRAAHVLRREVLAAVERRRAHRRRRHRRRHLRPRLGAASRGRRALGEGPHRPHRRLAAEGVVAADAPGRVEITLTDGTVLVGEVARSAGGPDNPLSDDALLAKFHANFGGESAVDPRARRAACSVSPTRTDLVRIHDLAAEIVAALSPSAPADTDPKREPAAMSFTAIEPESFPWYDYKGYTFSLGLQHGDSAINSGHSASAFDPELGKPASRAAWASRPRPPTRSRQRSSPPPAARSPTSRASSRTSPSRGCRTTRRRRRCAASCSATTRPSSTP